MTNKELQELLKQYPDDINVYKEYDGTALYFEIKKMINMPTDYSDDSETVDGLFVD